MAYHDKETIMLITLNIGTLLMIDNYTAMGNKGKFIILCVQVNMELLLNTVLVMEDERYAILYVGLELL